MVGRDFQHLYRFKNVNELNRQGIQLGCNFNQVVYSLRSVLSANGWQIICRQANCLQRKIKRLALKHSHPY